uniref:Uncharacterized protein n=1 Tax=Saccharum spontaneum TaxID=62335 RepID=A0A678T6C4_SACSP|nr:hypothetical protein SS48H02_000010 [Saccharum spontaneum]
MGLAATAYRAGQQHDRLLWAPACGGLSATLGESHELPSSGLRVMDNNLATRQVRLRNLQLGLRLPPQSVRK